MIILSYEERLNILNELNKNYDVKKSFEERGLGEFTDYDVCWVEDLPTEDEGDYQTQLGGAVYRLLIDKEETNMTFMENWVRSGSYSSGFCYEYEELCLCEQFKRVVTDWKIIY